MYLDAIPNTSISIPKINEIQSHPDSAAASAFSLFTQLEHTIALTIDRDASDLEKVLQKYSQNSKEWPVLHYAVDCGDKEAIRILLDNGYNIDERLPPFLTGEDYVGRTWEDGMCPLELAFEMQDLSMIEFLLKNRANPNSMRSNGHFSRSILYQAMEGFVIEFHHYPFGERPKINGFDLNVLKLIIASGEDLNQECFRNHYYSRTPLQVIENWATGYDWWGAHKEFGKEYQDILRKLLIDGGAAF